MAGGHQNETSPCSKTKHKLLNRTLNRTLNDSDAIKEKEKKLTPLQNVLADNIVDKYLSSETEWYDPKSIKRDVTIFCLETKHQNPGQLWETVLNHQRREAI